MEHQYYIDFIKLETDVIEDDRGDWYIVPDYQDKTIRLILNNLETGEKLYELTVVGPMSVLEVLTYTDSPTNLLSTATSVLRDYLRRYLFDFPDVSIEELLNNPRWIVE